MRRTAPIVCSLLLASSSIAAPRGEKLTFQVAPGSKVLKEYKAEHELRIDDMGMVLDELPFVSEKSGGWISSSMRLEFLDDYRASEAGRPLEFVRQIREASSQGKANVTRQTGQVIEESARSVSPLRQQQVHFTWIPAEQDWSRCFERIDAEEEWLADLRGEYEFLALLPGREVATGESWSVDLAQFASVLAPGGNLLLTPGTGNLFGRLMELGVGGDFADFYQPLGGSLEATYQGTREVDVGTGDAARKLTVGVITLQANVASSSDRTQLYRQAMPEDERKENARLENCTVEYSLMGSGELLWDLAAGRAHSFSLKGEEGFVATVVKTRFEGKDSHKITQISRYSGPLRVTVSFSDGANVAPGKERNNPKLEGGGPRKGKKGKKGNK